MSLVTYVVGVEAAKLVSIDLPIAQTEVVDSKGNTASAILTSTGDMNIIKILTC